MMMIQKARAMHEEGIQSNLAADPKSFWDYIRTKKGKTNRQKVTKDGNILTDKECASEFAKYFKSVYGNSAAVLDVDKASAAVGSSSARVHLGRLTLDEVGAALARLKPKRSAGPDGIPAFVVRDCASVLAEPLTHIFNLCLDASHFPERWKITRVVPIPKSGTETDVTLFRPVATLSTPAKVFESAIQQSVQEQVSPHLSDAQHGFRRARSTTSNLLTSMAYIVPQVDAGVQVDAAYFDFKKAFDLVDNDILLAKLAAVGFTNKLLNFFASYMRDRKQYVEYAGCTSEPYLTRTGVSQGSNLGPLQFSLMINDLPQVVGNAGCLLFADDLKLLMPVKDANDCERLQRDVDRVVEWSRNNRLQFNIDKCSIITFSRARTPLHHNYNMAGTPLQRTDKIRDLGVGMTTGLTFREHVLSTCKKAYRTLGFVLRNAGNFSNASAVAALYNALVRSQLESNAIVWAPHEAKYSQMVELIQNKFVRYLYFKLDGVYPSYPLMYPTLFVLGMVGYNKLQVRRELALALYTLKVLLGKVSNPKILESVCLCVPDNFVGRRRKPPLLAVPRGRTNLLTKAPLTRTIHTLNLVADNIDLFSCSMNEFARTTLFVLCYT